MSSLIKSFQEIIDKYYKSEISMFSVIGFISYFGRISHEDNFQKRKSFTRSFVIQNIPLLVQKFQLSKEEIINIVDNAEFPDIDTIIYDIGTLLLKKRLNDNSLPPTSEDIMWYFNAKKELKDYVNSTSYNEELDRIKFEQEQLTNEFSEIASKIVSEEDFDITSERFEMLVEKVNNIAEKITEREEGINIEDAYNYAVNVVLEEEKIDLPEIREVIENECSVSIALKNLSKNFDKLDGIMLSISNNYKN